MGNAKLMLSITIFGSPKLEVSGQLPASFFGLQGEQAASAGQGKGEVAP